MGMANKLACATQVLVGKRHPRCSSGA
jgi:hypothetical protein